MSPIRSAIGRPWPQSRPCFKGVHVYSHVLVSRASITTVMSPVRSAIGRPWLQSRPLFKGVHVYSHVPISCSYRASLSSHVLVLIVIRYFRQTRKTRGFLPTHKPGFTGLIIGGFTRFFGCPGTRVAFPIEYNSGYTVWVKKVAPP